MKYIDTLQDGMHVSGVYLCKTKTIALTKNGKEYGNLTLQDKTGQLEAKIWDLNSPAIRDFEAMDYVQVEGNVTVFNNANQLNIHRIQVASDGQYDPADYFPVSEKDIDEMKEDLLKLIRSVNNPYLQKLLASYFEDPVFMKAFSRHSAARSVHHGFIGGLLEHSLSVATICDNIAGHYPFVNRDLLVTGAILHDVGKLSELSPFPMNEYTDAGQLLGHIIIGAQMVSVRISRIEGFPKKLANELIHMILSHHGELEYGSPKKPAIMEALILSFVDNMDAKVETMHEAIKNKPPVNADGWLGFNKLLDSNIRKTSES
ncbi:MAG: HD domain-containing protein [Lachnospiraceae bacterium]|nr:HD domain-containing protein [Lachnospiraceae bacterium]